MYQPRSSSGSPRWASSPILTFRIMGTFVVRDGRIARYTDYYDSLGAARSLGRLG